MPESTCSIPECDGLPFSRGWCSKHYARWHRHGDPLVRKHRHDANRIDLTQSKACLECGAIFHPTPGRAHSNWERQRCCGARCSNALKARGRAKDKGDLTRKELGSKAAYQVEYQRRKAMPHWAAWWEDKRRAEELADLEPQESKPGPRCRLTQRPTPRHFTAGYCLGCDGSWVDYPRRKPSGYCNRCQDRRWAADSRHKRRAWKANTKVVEVISPEVVFKRDGYRCQLCGIKTRGKTPNPKAPTIDHIVPLAEGGDHSYLNTQCACFGCNSRKGARGANDQLRLVA